jgi:ribosome-associated protein
MAIPAEYAVQRGSGPRHKSGLDQKNAPSRFMTCYSLHLLRTKLVTYLSGWLSTRSANPITPVFFGVTIIATHVVEMNRQPIELFKILKFEGLANSGGQAKLMIADGLVKLNGKVETQKSKKILSGDVIEFQEHKLEMLLKLPEEAAPESVEQPADQPSEPPAEA